jgi:hypothetical protein
VVLSPILRNADLHSYAYYNPGTEKFESCGPWGPSSRAGTIRGRAGDLAGDGVERSRPLQATQPAFRYDVGPGPFNFVTKFHSPPCGAV